MFEHRNNFLSKIEKRISEGIGNVLAAQSSAHARRTDPSALYTFGRNDEGVLFLCGFKDERRVSEIEVPEGIGAVYEGAFMRDNEAHPARRSDLCMQTGFQGLQGTEMRYFPRTDRRYRGKRI